jgi:hypothetical protein
VAQQNDSAKIAIAERGEKRRDEVYMSQQADASHDQLRGWRKRLQLVQAFRVSPHTVFSGGLT